MNISGSFVAPTTDGASQAGATTNPSAGRIHAKQSPLRQEFEKTVGALFYGEMLKALRSTAGKPAYLHGGKAEEMFQSQLDQTIVDSMVAQPGKSLVGNLFKRFEDGLKADTSAGTAETKSVSASGTAKTLEPLRPLRAEELTQLVRDAQIGQDAATATTRMPAIGPLVRK